jgi:phosphopantothenoylcysteine decarboxylase/phosphopantothenate--cysteine ligase
MQEAVMRHTAEADIFIACAAVSDYRVDQVAAQKMKKSGQSMTLQLQPTSDILAGVSALEDRPFCVGFAAETQDLEKNARAKLNKKNLDMIVANKVGGDASGFEIDFNEVTVIWNGGQQILELASKSAIAKQLIDLIAERYNNQ